MSFLIFLLLSITTDNIQLSSSPEKVGSVTLSDPLKIMDEEGYYESIHSTISPNGSIIIYDTGNKLMFVYNSAGKLKHSFGKEGNGPGEFSRIFGLSANDNYIYVRGRGRKIMIFTHSGKLVREITSNITFSSTSILLKDRLRVLNLPSPHTKHLMIDFNLDGTLKLTKSNPTYNPKAKREQRRFNPERMKERFNAPRGLTSTEDGFIRYYGGVYKLEKVDTQLTPTMVMSRPFVRIKETEDPEFLQRMKQRMGSTPQGKKRMAQVVQIRDNLTEGYLSDIQSILGTESGYIFVQTASEKKTELSIDIISPTHTFYDQIKLTGDEVLSATVINKKLIVNYSNENDGPYAMVYTIHIK